MVKNTNSWVNEFNPKIVSPLLHLYSILLFIFIQPITVCNLFCIKSLNAFRLSYYISWGSINTIPCGFDTCTYFSILLLDLVYLPKRVSSHVSAFDLLSLNKHMTRGAFDFISPHMFSTVGASSAWLMLFHLTENLHWNLFIPHITLFLKPTYYPEVIGSPRSTFSHPIS